MDRLVRKKIVSFKKWFCFFAVEITETELLKSDLPLLESGKCFKVTFSPLRMRSEQAYYLQTEKILFWFAISVL